MSAPLLFSANSGFHWINRVMSDRVDEATRPVTIGQRQPAAIRCHHCRKASDTDAVAWLFTADAAGRTHTRRCARWPFLRRHSPHRRAPQTPPMGA